MGQIFTFSGPRGVGKTTIMDDLRDISGVEPIVPFTTRAPREHETEGRDYHFVTDYEFDAIRRTRGMFDVLTLRDNKYGTPLQEFDKVIGREQGGVESIATINLAATSAIELRKEIGNAAVHSIFVLPECWDDIERQMREKGIPEEQIVERRSSEPTDLTLLPEFNKLIVNPYGNRVDAFRNVAAYIAKVSGIEISTTRSL